MKFPSHAFSSIAIFTVLTCCSATASAQLSVQRWVPLDSSPAGTSAEINLDDAASNTQSTSFDVIVHGYWLSYQSVAGATYAHINVPGLGTKRQTGFPAVPVARLSLAVLTGTTNAAVKATRISGTQAFQGVLLWPEPIAGTDGAPGRPEEFSINNAAYQSAVPFPANDGATITFAARRVGSIPGITVEVYPVHWVASTRVLTVNRLTHFTVLHPGPDAPPPPMTFEQYSIAQKTYLNLPNGLGTLPPLDPYVAHYLFVYPPAYQNALQPLMDQKTARGYQVSHLLIEGMQPTCDAVRTAISTWYSAMPVHGAKYALLVGDMSQIPFCTSPDGFYTDHPYASLYNSSVDPLIYLGRLFVHSSADVTAQVSKILAYEDSLAGCCYNKVLLMANKQGAPGVYVGAQEAVRTATYSTPPAFITAYGSESGVTNTTVSNDIDGGLGLVAYRGHGSTDLWWNWDLSGEDYTSADASLLTDHVPQVPVVWSIACETADLMVPGSLAETFMQNAASRAVSFYGATNDSLTADNHVLDQALFKAVYGLGFTNQAHAIQYAEATMTSEFSNYNAWLYILLGDPDMSIRVRNPIQLSTKLPFVSVSACTNCSVGFSVADNAGNPVINALVSFSQKDSSLRGLGSAYTDGNGNVTATLPSITAGSLNYYVRTQEGDVQKGAIPVR